MNYERGLLNGQGLVAVIPDFQFDFKYQIVSYDWVFKIRNDIYMGTVIGKLFSQDLISKIKSSNPNDVLIVENVKVKGDDDLIRKVAGLSVVIK